VASLARPEFMAHLCKHTPDGVQRDRILALLLRSRGDWVPLTQILELHISQYGARIFELRRLGFQIENKTWWLDGRRHSAFRLALGAKVAPTVPAGSVPPLTPQQHSLFDCSVEFRDHN